jgi:hypothetical protein
LDKRSTTTKDVALLLQLRDAGQLILAPEFQRNSVWPRPAKAFLIDTILADRPIPLLFFARAINAQTGRSEYEVIDGQQRLRAVFEFYDNRFSLTESPKETPWYGKRWRNLDNESRQKILSYDFIVEELTGYGDKDIRDMFRRMNRYVVRLNAQEQRHAVTQGKFKDFAEEVGSWPFWIENRIFSRNAADRRRTDEFAAELAILLLEGPQDKKSTLDLYFSAYEEKFPLAEDLRTRLLDYTKLLAKALPKLSEMQLRRAANFYALVGALDLVTNEGEELATIKAKPLGAALTKFDSDIRSDTPSNIASRYLRAASRQTDNIGPRQTRIRILSDIIQQVS